MYKGSSGQSPEVLSELALLVRTRGKPRGIEPIFRLRSDDMKIPIFISLLASRNKKNYFIQKLGRVMIF